MQFNSALLLNQFFWFGLSFMIISFFCFYILVPYLLKNVQKREKYIAKLLDEANECISLAEKTKNEIEKDLDNAKIESSVIITKAKIVVDDINNNSNSNFIKFVNSLTAKKMSEVNTLIDEKRNAILLKTESIAKKFAQKSGIENFVLNDIGKNTIQEKLNNDLVR